MKIAAVLACHNRKEKTLACLASLLDHELLPGVELSVYLLDDGSTDGTSEAIAQKYPDVNILQGDGSYFWNGGMRAAFGAAIDEDHDFYLWLNDDVELYEGFLARLMQTRDKIVAIYGPAQIVVGAVKDPANGKLTYSGMRRVSPFHPTRYEKIEPDSTRPLECESMNGNCVLIPASIVKKIGNMSPVYTHAMGDMDYGFRARENGARLWVAPDYVGECESNDKQKRWEDPSLSMRQRLKNLNSPHGLPVREYAHFVRSQSKYLWPLFVILPYAKVLGRGGKALALESLKKSWTYGKK